jgi:hypothetical protein
MSSRAVDGESIESEPPAYEPPAIAWEEPYEAVGFGVSCAQLDGSPLCFPGPILT